MNERDFAQKKQSDWDKLAAIVRVANSTAGKRALTTEQLLSLGPLYRRASADLARARRHALSPDLVEYLNALVGQAHSLLYGAEVSSNPFKAVLDFYLYEFPAVLQKRSKAFFAAMLLTLVGGIITYSICIKHPDDVELFVEPGFKESLEQWKSGKVSESAHLEQSGMLMTHNLQVGLTAFALGVVCVPDVSLMYYNGATLGAFAAEMTRAHAHATFWPGIVPHGIAELSAIFVCGGAGFALAGGLLMPGSRRRSDALKAAAQDAIKMALGTIPMFIFAGMVEGMFSHQPIAPSYRYLFAIINGTGWYLYLFLPRTNPKAAAA
jgi:uncharacterized membrane protein SpoIIM required for sporulation